MCVFVNLVGYLQIILTENKKKLVNIKAMIAFAGLMRLSRGQQDASLAMTIRPRWPLSELPKVS